MAEKKIVSAKSVKDKKSSSKSTGLNIDLSELKKIGSAILAFIASNPELVSKLLEKPATYLKKIVNGEKVSETTKKTVNKTINANKAGGITSILTSLSGLSNGDRETDDIFGNITSTLKKSKASGIDVGSLIGGLLNTSSSTKSSKKTSKKKASSSSGGLADLIKGLFK